MNQRIIKDIKSRDIDGIRRVRRVRTFGEIYEDMLVDLQEAVRIKIEDLLRTSETKNSLAKKVGIAWYSMDRFVDLVGTKKIRSDLLLQLAAYLVVHHGDQWLPESIRAIWSHPNKLGTL